MVRIKFPGEWEENEQDEHEFSNAAYGVGAVLAFIGFVAVCVGTCVALSWPLSWLWNIGIAGPLDLPLVTWYEFTAGWGIMFIMIQITKKIFRG